MMAGLFEELEEARAVIRGFEKRAPDCVIVLGSGLAGFSEKLSDLAVIPYTSIPGFPALTVQGHTGRLVIGAVSGRVCAVLEGRPHAYEGHPPDRVVFPLRTVLGLGKKTVILTNAAGGVNPSLMPGELMLVTDHINLTGQNPLTGPNDDRVGPRFPDMSEAYSKKLREAAFAAAREAGVNLKVGVYAGVPGPSYETPAEVKMLRTLGADAVGMSTVMEAIAARHMGAEVLCISCITNVHGKTGAPKHEEVLARSAEAAAKLAAVLEHLVGKV